MAEQAAPDLNRVSRLALAVVALAGFADAVSFLQFKKIYVSFMSGNTTALGVATAAADWEQARLLALLLVLFVGGVMLGTWLHQAGRQPAARVLAVVAGLLALAAGLPAKLPLFVLIISMGTLNAAVGKAGRGPLTLTYVTGALVKVGTGLVDRLKGKPLPEDWGRQALDWLWLAVGAIIGAAAWHRFGLRVLLGGAAWALLLALLARRVPEA